ncbi:hypothetical protein [Runella sp.]|uniref:hypothetical protein n=1 Tax=Runella sp. TaxID=1960881 RepID=UPI003D0C1331
MKTKKEQLLQAISADNIPAALRIAKDFTKDFTKDEQRILQIAHECNDASKAHYYTQLGINVYANNVVALELLNSYYQKRLTINHIEKDSRSTVQ